MNNNNNMKQGYSPPEEGYKIYNKIIRFHPSKRRITKCICVKEVEQVTTMSAFTTHHEAMNELIVKRNINTIHV